MGDFNETILTEAADMQNVFVNSCKSLPEDKTVLYVGSQRVDGASDLFYAPMTVCGRYTLKGLLDSGSMSCTLSEEGESKLQADGILWFWLAVVALRFSQSVHTTWRLKSMDLRLSFQLL